MRNSNFGINFGNLPKLAEVHLAEVRSAIWRVPPQEAACEQCVLLKAIYILTYYFLLQLRQMPPLRTLQQYYFEK